MSDLSQVRIPSMRDRVSNAEWQTRVDLAACYRLVHHYRMDDLVYNHISARVPGEEGHFLINAYGMTYDEITASSLVKIDFDGKRGAGLGHRLRHQPRRLRDPQRGAPRAAGRGLRDPHPHAGRHGGLGDGMRPAAAHAERDVLLRRRLPRLRGPGGRPRRAEAPGEGPRQPRRHDPAQPRPARGRRDHSGGVHHHVLARPRLPGAGLSR